MRVDVNAARENVPARRVDGAPRVLGRELRGDGRDLVALDAEVG